MQILCTFANRLAIEARTCQAQQGTLPSHAHLRVPRVNQPTLLLNGQAQLFFQPVQLDFELSDLLV